MSNHTTFFVQQCPTCGRRLRICVEYLGKSIQCRHCRAIFTACDPELSPSCSQESNALLQRVDELLNIPDPVEH
jgi:hypothetical protein